MKWLTLFTQNAIYNRFVILSLKIEGVFIKKARCSITGEDSGCVDNYPILTCKNRQIGMMLLGLI